MLQGGEGRPDGGEDGEHDKSPFGQVSFIRFDLSNDQPYGEEYEEHEEKQEGDGDQLGELDRVEVLKEGGGGVVALAEMGLLQHHLYLRFHKVPTST